MIVTPLDRSDAIDAGVEAAMEAFATRGDPDGIVMAAAANGDPRAALAIAARLALAPIVAHTAREIVTEVVDGLLEAGYVIGRRA